MLYDRTQALSVSVKPDDQEREAWAWAIHRDPNQMLILRSRPDYASPDQALEAGGQAAAEIARKLGIPVAIRASGKAKPD